METDPNGEARSKFALFEEISSAKSRFFDAIVGGRSRGRAVDARELRQECILEIAKFYYLLKLCDINSAKKLRDLALFHDQKIEALLEHAGDGAIEGRYRDRLRSALFDTERKLDRLEAHCGTNRISLSQSSLAMLLAEHMSSETCRVAVKSLSGADYLSRAKSPFGAMLIRSTGRMEQHFEAYARSLGRRSAGSPTTTRNG